MTAGIAKIIMNDVMTCAQTKRGMRFRDIPGARCLKTVVMSHDGARQGGNFCERDHLRPEIDAMTGRIVRPG